MIESLTSCGWRAQWHGPPAARYVEASLRFVSSIVLVSMDRSRICLRTSPEGVTRAEMNRVIADLDAALTAAEEAP